MISIFFLFNPTLPWMLIMDVNHPCYSVRELEARSAWEETATRFPMDSGGVASHACFSKVFL